MHAAAEMPRYRCHKEVWALKIAAFDVHENGSAIITPKDKGYSFFAVDADWVSRWHGSEDDLGYFVQYADGYTSWSPTKAFDEGYTRI